MSKVAIGVAVGAVVVGAAAYGTLVYPTQRVRAEVDKAIAEMSGDTKISYQSLSYSLFSRTLTMGDIRMTLREGDEVLNVQFQKAVMRGLSARGVAEIHANGITMEDEAKTAHIDAERLDGEGIEGDEAIFKGQPGSAAVKRIALSGVTLTTEGDKVNIREVVMGDLVQTGKTPSAVAFGLHGMDVDAAKIGDADARQAMTELGYNKLSLDLDIAYEHQAEAKRLTLKNVSVGGAEMGKVSLSASFGGIATLPQDDPEAALALLQTATLEKLELRYDDSSLAPRLFKMAAKQEGIEVQAWKDGIVAQINDGLGQPDAQPLTREVLNSAATFLAEPKSLTMRMNPAKPLPLMLMAMGAQNPEGMIQAAGLTVFANR